MTYPYITVPDLDAALGLIVLQEDETLEGDMRAMLPPILPAPVPPPHRCFTRWIKS